MIYFLFGLAFVYTSLAFIAFTLIPEARKLADFERKKEYYLYFFDYICLFFSVFAIFASFASFFVDFFDFQEIISIPLMHLICDSILFLLLQPKLAEKGEINTEIKENRRKNGILSKIKRFLDDPLQIIHHVLLISIYLLGIWQKGASLYVIFIFFDEISVPLLLLKKQLQRLKFNVKNSLFETIEYTFIGVYILSRGVVLPLLGFYWAVYDKKSDFIGIFMICAMNWINSFWVMQTLCLFYKKNQLKWLKFLEDYRKGGNLKVTVHMFLAILFVVIPNYLYYVH